MTMTTCFCTVVQEPHDTEVSDSLC